MLSILLVTQTAVSTHTSPPVQWHPPLPLPARRPLAPSDSLARWAHIAGLLQAAPFTSSHCPTPSALHYMRLVPLNQHHSHLVPLLHTLQPALFTPAHHTVTAVTAEGTDFTVAQRATAPPERKRATIQAPAAAAVWRACASSQSHHASSHSPTSSL